MSLHDFDDNTRRMIKRTKLQKLLDVAASTMRGLEEDGVLTPRRLGRPPYAHVYYTMAEAAPLLAHGVPAVPEPEPEPAPPAPPKLERLKLATRRRP